MTISSRVTDRRSLVDIFLVVNAPGFYRYLHGGAAGMGVSATETGDAVADTGDAVADTGGAV